MAKKFDLAALMGEAVSESDTGEMRVEQIPLAEIEGNENNSYAQTGIDELAESIQVIGLQQPLVVRRKTEGGYLLLAGHRRRNALEKLERKTAPCIVLDANLDPALQTLILHWTNTMARGGGGLTAEYTATAAKEIEEALKELQMLGIVELPGKLRSYVAEVLKTSESQIARAKAIDNGLTDDWKGLFKNQKINDSTAYELSQCDEDLQHELHEIYGKCLFSLDGRKVRAHRKAARYDFTPVTCPADPHALEPCTGADKRAGWVEAGSCEGCCHTCTLAETCNRVCGKVKQRLKNEKEKAEREENHEQQLAEFNVSPLVAARKNIRFALARKDILNVDDLPKARYQWYMSWLWAPDPLNNYVPRLDELFEMAKSLEIDPFEMICGHEAGSIWHKCIDERPPEGARVLCKLCGCAGRYGEYVCRDGKWYFPEFAGADECEANILVSAWTEVFPE